MKNWGFFVINCSATVCVLYLCLCGYYGESEPLFLCKLSQLKADTIDTQGNLYLLALTPSLQVAYTEKLEVE